MPPKIPDDTASSREDEVGTEGELLVKATLSRETLVKHAKKISATATGPTINEAEALRAHQISHRCRAIAGVRGRGMRGRVGGWKGGENAKEGARESPRERSLRRCDGISEKVEAVPT